MALSGRGQRTRGPGVATSTALLSWAKGNRRDAPLDGGRGGGPPAPAVRPTAPTVTGSGGTGGPVTLGRPHDGERAEALSGPVSRREL